MIRTNAAIEQQYAPRLWGPYSAALAVHFMLIAWNPTLFVGGPSFAPPEMMQVEFRDQPVMEPALPKPPPPKVAEKKKPRKARHKSGLAKKAPVVAARHPTPRPAPKRFVSKIAIPKFIPHSMDDAPIAASPIPATAAAAPRRMTAAFAPAPKLKAKTRGIRAEDIHFELADKGSITAGSQVVAIPIGEERGDHAVLPNAPMLHNAPKGVHTNFQPGLGRGMSELAGKNRVGYHGAIESPNYQDGEMAASGETQTKSIGQGFEVAGPVGDRKIVRRKLPEYPAWAEEKGITALVRIYFTVRPDGSIRSNLRIERSSGYTELDQLAKEALLNWKFSPTSSGAGEEAWGIITFKFTLA
ncbi:MAG TPA: energy transducer TonB [Elusimicrobiota bacterium]|nr:energy transducer TonB [Elusimicrobiota bacterium]